MNIDELIKEAILEKNPAKRDAYRAIKSDLILIQTDAKNARPVEYNDIIIITKKLIKIKEEDINMYREGLKNPSLDEKTKNERELTLKNYIEQIKYLKELLPPEIPVSKIEEAVTTAYPNGYTQKEIGKVIKEIKSIYPTAEGKVISDIVKKHIN